MGGVKAHLYREKADVISPYISVKILCCPSIESDLQIRNFSFLHRAPITMLLYVLVFISLANTPVTGLDLKPNCTVQTFSCHCKQNSGSGATDLGKVSVTRCVTDGNHSKDVCSSEDVTTKCHEIKGLYKLRDFSHSSCFSFFFNPSQELN